VVSAGFSFGTQVAKATPSERGGNVVLKKFTWPAELTLSLIGGKWKGLILHHLLIGESKRFGELKKLSRGISAKILAKHLKELEFDGLITRMVTGTDKPRILYAPTERSRTLAPVLAAIQQWGTEHLDAYAEEDLAIGIPGLSQTTAGRLPAGAVLETPASAIPVRERGSEISPIPASANRETGRAGTSAGAYERSVPDIALVS
jgi:DNA-binding HxlR family transcriptional regulator